MAYVTLVSVLFDHITCMVCQVSYYRYCTDADQFEIAVVCPVCKLLQLFLCGSATVLSRVLFIRWPVNELSVNVVYQA